MEIIVAIIVGLISTTLGAFAAAKVVAIRRSVDRDRANVGATAHQLAVQIEGFRARADEHRVQLETYRGEHLAAACANAALRGVSDAELARMGRSLTELRVASDRCWRELGRVGEAAREADGVARQVLASGSPWLFTPEPHRPSQHHVAEPPALEDDSETGVIEVPLTRREPLSGPTSQTMVGVGPPGRYR